MIDRTIQIACNEIHDLSSGMEPLNDLSINSQNEFPEHSFNEGPSQWPRLFRGLAICAHCYLGNEFWYELADQTAIHMHYVKVL